MRIRKVLRNTKRELPKAGEKTGGLLSSDKGISLPAKGKNYHEKSTHGSFWPFGITF